MPKRTWTSTQEAHLRRVFPITKDRDLEDVFGMKKNKVKSKARRMGLQKDRTWSVEDEGTLFINFNTMNRKELAKKLGRSYHACANKYARLIEAI